MHYPCGSVIGSDGLGFARDGEDWEKIEHLGEVILGNNVEIGSNCSIDRGSAGIPFLMIKKNSITMFT
ncbi:MAG: hypothetical protein CM1200mP12_22150 [Gammaproteobacteria bacterium]|nr:MAG: hypothetical protein CM1200mP12_22150 [Gammaproteobacteria bacterium]